MATIKNHCADCKYYLRDKYEEIHQFLDQYANIFSPAFFEDYHRTFLHNSYGIELIKQKWGVEGYEAGIIHLTRDYIGATITNYSLYDIEYTLFPKIKMWFDLLRTEYNPHPHVLKGWENIGLVAKALS
jgi:hypothetical protein